MGTKGSRGDKEDKLIVKHTGNSLLISDEDTAFKGERCFKYLPYFLRVLEAGCLIVHIFNSQKVYFMLLADVDLSTLKDNQLFYYEAGSIESVSRDYHKSRAVFTVKTCRLPTKGEYHYYQRINQL